MHNVKKTLEMRSVHPHDKRLGLRHDDAHIRGRDCEGQWAIFQSGSEGKLVRDAKHHPAPAVTIARGINNGILSFRGHTFAFPSRLLSSKEVNLVVVKLLEVDLQLRSGSQGRNVDLDTSHRKAGGKTFACGVVNDLTLMLLKFVDGPSDVAGR